MLQCTCFNDFVAKSVCYRTVKQCDYTSKWEFVIIIAFLQLSLCKTALNLVPYSTPEVIMWEGKGKKVKVVDLYSASS